MKLRSGRVMKITPERQSRQIVCYQKRKTRNHQHWGMHGNLWTQIAKWAKRNESLQPRMAIAKNNWRNKQGNRYDQIEKTEMWQKKKFMNILEGSKNCAWDKLDMEDM